MFFVETLYFFQNHTTTVIKNQSFLITLLITLISNNDRRYL